MNILTTFNQLINYSVTEVFVVQPRLHKVCKVVLGILVCLKVLVTQCYNFLTTLSQFSHNFCKNFSQISYNFLTNFSQFSHNFLTTLTQLYQTVLTLCNCLDILQLSWQTSNFLNWPWLVSVQPLFLSILTLWSCFYSSLMHCQFQSHICIPLQWILNTLI